MQKQKVKTIILNEIIRERIFKEEDKIFLVSNISKLKDIYSNKDIVSNSKKIIFNISDEIGNKKIKNKFENIATKRIVSTLMKNEVPDVTLYDILLDLFNSMRLGLKHVVIDDVTYMVGDSVVLNNNSKERDLIISEINESSIVITDNFNTDNSYTYNHVDIPFEVNVEETTKFSILSSKINHCIEDYASIKDDLEYILESYSKDILDASIREKFLYKCKDKISSLSASENTDLFLIEIIRDELNKLNINKNTISVGDKHFYIGSYVAFKDMPYQYNTIITNISDNEVTIEHKFIKDKFTLKLSHEEFRNKVFLISDVFDTEEKTINWSHEEYNPDMLPMLLSEGILRFNSDKGECFNVKTHSEIYLNELKNVVLDRVSDMKDTVMAEHYIMKCMQPLTNKSYIDSNCRERSVIDTFDTIWESMNMCQESFVIDGKRYRRRDKIALKGYNGIKEFTIGLISDNCIILSASHNDEILTKKYHSVIELRKNVWRISDIKHLEMKYINPITELNFDKLLEYERIINGAICNAGTSEDKSYITNLSYKIALEIKDRVELYSCMLSRIDYIEYITAFIKSSNIYNDILPKIDDKKEVISILKENTFAHIESLGGVKLGQIYNTEKNFIFEDTRENKYKFSYKDIYNSLINIEYIPEVETKEANTILDEIESIESNDDIFAVSIETKDKEDINSKDIIDELDIEDAVNSSKNEDVEIKSEVEIETEVNTNVNVDIEIEAEDIINKNSVLSVISKFVYKKNKSYLDKANFNNIDNIENYLKSALGKKIQIKDILFESGKIHIDNNLVEFKSKSNIEFKYTIDELIRQLKNERDSEVKQVSFFDLI